MPLATLHERRVLALRSNINHPHVDVKFFDSREALIDFCSAPTDSEKPKQTICVVPDSVIGAAALIAVVQSEHPEHGFYYLKCCDTARPEPDSVKQWFFAGQQQFPNALHFTLHNGQFFAVVPEPWSPTPKTGWPQTVVLIGGRGKIGSTIAKAAINAGSKVIQTSRSTSTPSVPGAQCIILNPVKPHAIEQFLGSIQAPEETAVIVCTGIVGFDAFEPLATTSANVFSRHSMAKADVAAHVIDALSRLGNHAPASLVVFSSLAAHIGGFGLGAYALANAEVEAIIQQAVDESTCPFTQLIALASDGWRLGEQESFSEQLLATALESEEALASIATLLQSPAPSVVALAHEHAFARKHGIPDQSKPDSHTRSISDSNMPEDKQDVFEELRSIWQEVLGIPITSNDADFFQLGGSSLLATKMLVLIEERTNKRLRLRDILQHSSINALAEQLISANNIETAPVAQESVAKTESPAPSAQLAPLTDVQRAYLIGRSSNFGDGAASCHSFIEYLAPQIDIQRFTKALNTVIQRHQMLRTIVTFDGMKEVLLPPHGYQVSVTDVRQQTDEKSAIDRWRTQWAQRPPRADRWPLIDVAIAQASDGVHIGWSVDVLVCDASSFEILISEIGDVYNGKTLTELPQSSFFDYANSSWKERHSTQNIARKEAQSYWAEITPILPPAPNIRSVEKKHGVFRRRAVNLGAELTERVTQCAREHKTTESAVMLAAYQTFLARWSQQTSFTVMVTYFERPEKYAGVVGDFTTVIPCVLSADDDLHAVSNRLFEAMDHRAVSGVEILAQRSTLEGKRFLLPVVFTSMLGSSLRETSWCGRICYGISQTPQVILDHQIYRGDDGIISQFDALDSAIDFKELDFHLGNYVSIVEEICTKNSASTNTTHEDSSDSAIALARKYWADTLNIPAESIADDATFISLGGDSIAAIKLLGSLRNAGYSVELEQLLGSLKLRDLKIRDDSRVTNTAQLVCATPGEPFPLTPLQQAYWIGAQGGWIHSHGSAHFYVDYFDQTCTGENFAQALKLLIHHQPMLRAKILPDGTQIILDPHSPELQKLPLTITDLTSSTPEEIQQIIHNQRDTWCTTPMNPEHWPPFRCAALLLPGGGARVAVQSSLAFVDGWSFYLFFEQLLALQDNPNTVFPTPSITFADYAVSLAALASSEEAAKDRQWWHNRIPRLAPAPLLPASLSKTTGMERKSLRYQKNVFDALASACTEANITPSSAFFAAYVYALSIASGQQQMLISSLYFNRLPLAPDIDQVLGPFATTALVNLDTDISQHQVFGPKEFAKLAQHIMSQLSDSLQHGNVSGIEVSRMAATMNGRGGNIAPVVFTSTLGFTDSTSVEVTSRIDPRDVFERVVTPQVLMDCQVAVENEDIVVNLDSPTGAFPSDFSAAMLATIDAAISAFIANTDIDATSVSRLTDETAKANQRLVLSLDANTAPHPELSHYTADHALLEQIQDLFHQFGAQTNGNNQLSFFAAGGDSLGMIRLLRQTQKDFNTSLTPADFLEDPTVLGVAIKLQQAPELHWTEHLVALTSKQQSPKAICYLIHPSGGDILCYLDFVRGLRCIEVFGIPDPGLSHEEIHDAMPTAIDQLCELYAEFIIQHQIDHGTNVPFFVGGWSMGGTVAQEIVQLLRERGYEAAGLIMIDSNSPDRIRHLSGITEEKYRIEYARRYLASIQAFTNDMARPHQTSFHFEDDFDLYLNERGQNSPETKRKIAVFTRHLEGLASWNARPLQQTPTLLLIAEQLSPVNSNIAMGVDDASDSATLGWESNIPDDSDIATVPAHHYSVLREPAVNNVSKLVAAFIQRHTTTQLDRFSPSLFEE
ncbi:MAG: condensation domain-containing protein [Corynebacterium sp.]|nr:condensation domain-containing protein [Corynebacterium sp.]